MAGTREDATLIVELAKWGAMIGLHRGEPDDLLRRLRPESAEALDHQVQTILVFHETIGTLVKNELLDRDLVLRLALGRGRVGPRRPRRPRRAREGRRARSCSRTSRRWRRARASRGGRRPRVPARLRPYGAVAASDRELPVAVFDSGVGGLTVLHECLVSLPHEDFLYLGDTARFPYGDRSRGRAARLRAASSRASCSSAARSCSWWPATRPRRRRCPRCARSSRGACRSWAWSRPSRGSPRRPRATGASG